MQRTKKKAGGRQRGDVAPPLPALRCHPPTPSRRKTCSPPTGSRRTPLASNELRSWTAHMCARVRGCRALWCVYVGRSSRANAAGVLPDDRCGVVLQTEEASLWIAPRALGPRSSMFASQSASRHRVKFVSFPRKLAGQHHGVHRVLGTVLGPSWKGRMNINVSWYIDVYYSTNDHVHERRIQYG